MIGKESGKDLTPLSGYAALTELYLTQDFMNFGTFPDLPSLTKLDLSENDAADISGLAGLSALAELRLSTNWITDLTPPASLSTRSMVPPPFLHPMDRRLGYLTRVAMGMQWVCNGRFSRNLSILSNGGISWENERG